MPAAPLPANEAERLEALRRTELLDAQGDAPPVPATVQTTPCEQCLPVRNSAYFFTPSKQNDSKQ